MILHGAGRLAEIAEQKLRGHAVDLHELRHEIAPVFCERDGKRTDVVVLGCTHYPLVMEEMKKVAPWAVDYLDPAPAIARRAADVVARLKLAGPQSGVPEPRYGAVDLGLGQRLESLAAYASMGFRRTDSSRCRFDRRRTLSRGPPADGAGAPFCLPANLKGSVGRETAPRRVGPTFIVMENRK